MDLITQLVGSVGGLLLITWVLVMLLTPFVWTWLFLRAFRDLHRISESLHWIAHCTKSDSQMETARSRVVAN